ncbi:response regulator [Pseudoroseomonas wenyumeiae]
MTSTIPVLLVEDELTNLAVLQTALEDGGYDVVVAANGTSAIQTLDGQSAGFAALVTDIRLGQGPSGWDVARRARELKPETSIVYITGDSSADWAVQGVPKSLLLQKPFALAQLITAVSTLLNEARSTPG